MSLTECTPAETVTLSCDVDVDVGTAGARLTCSGAGVRARDGAWLLRHLDLDIAPGELVAIVGASGAGKSTLLGLLGAIILPTEGAAFIDGAHTARLPMAARRRVGVVPQDDVVHFELPVGRVVDHAARLRLPAGATRAELQAASRRALDSVALEDHRDQRVAELSGGQRRRLSIALELVAQPSVCLLDEPTSGLDPGTAAIVVDHLRCLADSGATVVFSTHHGTDLTRCDRVIALLPGGIPSYVGPVDLVGDTSGSADPDAFHRSLVEGTLRRPSEPVPPPLPIARVPRTRAAVGRQWLTLTRRTLETIARTPLTLAIMTAAPATVVAMFAVLFRAGAFAPTATTPTAAIMITFWVAFGGFFFGLAYGLLQICTELTIMRRERHAGVWPGLQLLAKLTALTPVLLAVVAIMLVILRGLDRLPAAGVHTYASIGLTLALDAIAALTLGLLASAAVRTPAQAALALPMLCFPAVLFSGAVLPVPVMAGPGRAISAVMSDRWAFEAIGHDLGLRHHLSETSPPLGPSLLDEYGATWTAAPSSVWITLSAFTILLTTAGIAILHHRCRR